MHINMRLIICSVIMVMCTCVRVCSSTREREREERTEEGRTISHGMLYINVRTCRRGSEMENVHIVATPGGTELCRHTHTHVRIIRAFDISSVCVCLCVRSTNPSPTVCPRSPRAPCVCCVVCCVAAILGFIIRLKHVYSTNVHAHTHTTNNVTLLHAHKSRRPPLATAAHPKSTPQLISATQKRTHCAQINNNHSAV